MLFFFFLAMIAFTFIHIESGFFGNILSLLNYNSYWTMLKYLNALISLYWLAQKLLNYIIIHVLVIIALIHLYCSKYICFDSAQILLQVSWTYYYDIITFCSDTIVLHNHGDYHYLSCLDYFCLGYVIMIMIFYIIYFVKW